jgi:DNA repair protein RecO (recombination protein O)
VAKGARRPRSALLAGTQFLCFGDYMMYKGANSYTINSCETIELFYNIRTDWGKLVYATKVTKMIRDVTTENQNCYRILQLYLNTLYTISETDKDLELVFSIFRMRLLCILGFSPYIGGCVTCGKKEDITHFSLKDSGLKCEYCHRTDTSCIGVNAGTIDAIRYIETAPAKRLFSFNLKEGSLSELEIVSKLYTFDKLEKDY